MEELIERAARDLIHSKYAIALSGAGISTESGIPDFRGPAGIWTMNPQAERMAYQSYDRFLEDPRGWWEEILSSPNLLGPIENALPNAGHYTLAELEQMCILKCVITQNVDGLHRKAGSDRVFEYHGSILKLRCASCGCRFNRDRFDLEELRRENKLPPRCPKCGGIVKSDVVAFGESIPGDVARKSLEEAWKCDLMLICGPSAVVYPFASLPRIARERKIQRQSKIDAGIYSVEKVPAVTIIEINAEPTSLTTDGISDYLIQGKTGELLPRIAQAVKSTAGGSNH